MVRYAKKIASRPGCLGLTKRSKSEPRRIACIVVLTVLAAAGCKDDWASRMGIVPAAKGILCPFPSYPLDKLRDVLAQDPPSFSFAVVGRTGLGGCGKRSRENFRGCRDIVETVFALEPQPRLLIHLGDISASPSTAREGWAQFVNLLGSHCRVPESLEDLTGATYPVLLALPGEKDVTDHKSEVSFLESLGFSRKTVYMSFPVGTLQFVVLNSEQIDDGVGMRWFGWNRERNRIRGAQLRWLEGQLAQSDARPKVVFLHKPFFPPVLSSHEGYCMDQYYWDRERVLRLFRKHGVVAVFSGHETVFSHCQVDGVDHFVVGGESRPPIRKPGEFRQFLFAAVYEEGMRVFTINAEGKQVVGEVWVNLGAGSESSGEES